MKAERNASCPCGSGKKYKKCCLLNDQKETTLASQSLAKEPDFTVAIRPELEKECDAALADVENGRLLKAKMTAKRLYQLYPDDHLVNFLQGVCLATEDKCPEAIPYLERAIQIFPFFSAAYLNLGLVYLQEGQPSAAVTCLKKVIELEGKRSELGQKAQEELNQFERLVCRKEGLTLEQYCQAEKSFNQAFACSQEGKHEEAIILFQKVLSINPAHVQSYGNVALAYAALGNKKQALECLDKALEIDPSYEPALQNRQFISKLNEGEKLEREAKEMDDYKELAAQNNKQPYTIVYDS